MLYGIMFAGDAQGGSRDSLTIVDEETARNHIDNAWSWAVTVDIERLNK